MADEHNTTVAQSKVVSIPKIASSNGSTFVTMDDTYTRGQLYSFASLLNK